ncbi:uncharacterized protein BJ171DRAFT_598587 [Polychytrium aggregatum]|uniref:uncharacterized protein n=1 Tax=Polychytrium aggregatum TaxID=110093 RepID=UPI0022FDC32D|nr:uncharacterized protein BJ171DRAFT_598587 [Polychytrium aggregatum]KAI9204989.1 hypothetical protein BJ171DRAFT_598587 [Polychytrium aggregatum]
MTLVCCLDGALIQRRRMWLDGSAAGRLDPRQRTESSLLEAIESSLTPERSQACLVRIARFAHPLLRVAHRSSPDMRSASLSRRKTSPKPAAGVRLDRYQLGDCVGKGAFGVVHSALNVETGEVVAIKQLKLNALSKHELALIMMEIDLLKELQHPKIVRYIGFFKTKEHLNIIMEYCENGSLQHIGKTFGEFPEPLVAIYVAQVLEGLIYLHDQGVIHRDIKGANILTTKDGFVKLADFGVATKLSDINDKHVVGSPYWMAPEVIELSGATTASDIWSVGCTTIELLQGKPPYHELAPMSALFRIVQDEHPPLPENASPLAKDFLLHCFQKDCNLRVTAKKLSKHPWVQAVKQKKVSSPSRGAPTGTLLTPIVASLENLVPESVGAEASLPVQIIEANPQDIQPIDSKSPERLARAQAVPKIDLSQKSTTSPPSSRSTPLAESQGKLLHRPSTASAQFTTLPAESPKSEKPGSCSTSVAAASAKKMVKEETESWDDDFDFEEAKKVSELQDKDHSLPRRLQAQTKSKKSTGGQIHKASLSAPPLASPLLPGAKPVPKALDISFESWDDDFEFQDLKLAPKSESPVQPTDKMQNAKPLATTSDPKTVKDAQRAINTSVEKYAENALFEDYGDFLHDSDMELSKKIQSHKLDFESNNDDKNDDSGNESDPFSEIEESSFYNEHHTKISVSIMEEFSRIRFGIPESVLIQHCDNLLNMLIAAGPVAVSRIVTYHCVIPLIELLETQISSPLACRLLSLINTVVVANMQVQENICLLGSLSVIFQYTLNKHPSKVRLEAGLFVLKLCRTSPLTLQMFISCRGLPILTQLLEDNYQAEHELVWIAIDAMEGVFELQGSTPKNYFCEILSKNGVLKKLTTSLLWIMADPDVRASSFIKKVAGLLLLFSQADSTIKEKLGRRECLKDLARALPHLSPSLQVVVLKCIKNVSMQSSTLDALQSVEMIQLISSMLSQKGSPCYMEVQNQAVTILFNLCRLSKERQELTALAGLIPQLQSFVASKSPLRQFALPILCDLTHGANVVVRNILWESSGVYSYMELLTDPYWSANSLEALGAWICDDLTRIEDVLVAPSGVSALATGFVLASKNSTTQFSNFLGPFQKLLMVSRRICQEILLSSPFRDKMLDRLEHPKVMIRLSVLKIVSTLVENLLSAPLTEGGAAAEARPSGSRLKRLGQHDPAVLVRELAKKVLVMLRIDSE